MRASSSRGSGLSVTVRVYPSLAGQEMGTGKIVSIPSLFSGKTVYGLKARHRNLTVK